MRHGRSDSSQSLRLLELERLYKAVATDNSRREDGGGTTKVGGRVLQGWAEVGKPQSACPAVPGKGRRLGKGHVQRLPAYWLVLFGAVHTLGYKQVGPLASRSHKLDCTRRQCRVRDEYQPQPP